MAGDVDWGQIVVSGLGLVGGLGGFTALLRARSQNRVDERTQLSKEQTDFRALMHAEIGRLSALTTTLSTDKDKLEERLAEQGRLIERLTTLDEVKERNIAELQKLNAELTQRVTSQQTEIEALREEKARVVQQLTVAQATKELLERENNIIRLEASGLRTQLDALRGGAASVEP